MKMLINLCQDFASCLSLLLTGSLEDRLRWTFRLYDVNRDGVLDRQELREVTASVRHGGSNE